MWAQTGGVDWGGQGQWPTQQQYTNSSGDGKLLFKVVISMISLGFSDRRFHFQSRESIYTWPHR